MICAQFNNKMLEILKETVGRRFVSYDGKIYARLSEMKGRLFKRFLQQAPSTSVNHEDFEGEIHCVAEAIPNDEKITSLSIIIYQ